MELFLNLLWVMIASALLWTWRTRWVHQRERKLEHPVREWTAIGLALVLLFFAVSMTDDLHADLILFDESSTNRRGSAIEMHAHRAAAHQRLSLHAAGPALVSSAHGARIPQLIEELNRFSASLLPLVCLAQRSGRAPPVSSL